MSTVWVLVNVYQSDLAYVHVGDNVDITTDAYPDTFHGKISYIAAALDPNTRTLQARIVTQNPQSQTKERHVRHRHRPRRRSGNALTVPDAAVLRDTENEPFVYVQTGNKSIRPPRWSPSAITQTAARSVQDGLKEGERVAGDGSLFLQFKNSLQH